LPNLLLTNICNRNCPYCFALGQIEAGTTRPNWQMSREELGTIVSYLDPRTDVVSLLGGEPTLHSDFAGIVKWLLAEGFAVKIFTNGCTSKLREIKQFCDMGAVNIILNLNMPDTYNEAEWKQVEKNCQTFGKNIALSFNVFEPDFTWQHTRDAIVNWDLSHNVRVGMTQPIKGMNNTYLLAKDLPRASSRLVEMAEDLAGIGVALGFDCGFRPCDFSTPQLSTLARCGTKFSFVCSPVLDIGPDLMVWRCFPFSVEKGVKLTDFKSFREVEQYFNDKWAAVQKSGNTEDCGTCYNMEIGSCHGGCLSRTFKNLDPERLECLSK
jgi:organic radical activating enzyme